LKNRKWFALQFIQRGEGKQAVAGKTVSVHYEGSLESGKVFDSSYPRKTIEFLRTRNVIEGWDEGIALLRVGDKARFVIPSSIWDMGLAGSNSTKRHFDFDVELMDVK
jgi:peptidyl-prolyl cis-trans isomerase A (cyclophilin A)